LPNLNSVFIHSKNIEGGIKSLEESRDSDHAPFMKFFFISAVGLAVVDPLAKFKECNFIRSSNIEGGLKFLKGTRDPDHAPFRGNV